MFKILKQKSPGFSGTFFVVYFFLWFSKRIGKTNCKIVNER